MQRKINLTPVICLRIEKTIEVKTSSGEFKVITPENPLLSKQVVTSKMNPSTQYQLTVELLSQYPIGLVM